MEQRSNAELRREKKPLERPKRERDIYKRKLRGGRAMLILPHTMSKLGRPACKQSSMAASKASAKVDSPDTRLACLQLRLMLMTTRLVSPKWGYSK